MATVQNLRILGYPHTPSTTQVIGTQQPTFQWTVSGSPTLFSIQINYNSSDFSNPLVNIPAFFNSLTQYVLAPEYTLTREGVYYARIMGYDGTWSNWSPTLTFQISISLPNPPTINSVSSPSNGFYQTVTGTKTANLYVYVNNNDGPWCEAIYPNGIAGSTWSYGFPLVAGDNNIKAVTSLTQSSLGILSQSAMNDIYLAVSIPEAYNVWNCFDEFGLLLGLPRIPEEKNCDYKKRLQRVYQLPANSTAVGLQNAMSRDLGVDPSSVSIFRLSDLMDPTYSGNLLNKDGNALGTPLERYAREVYDQNPVFYGNVLSDESYWDGVDESTNGYRFLPHIWDSSASGIYDKWQTGGIGDQDDLWVGNPIPVWNPGISGVSWYLPIHSGYFYSANPSGIIS
jgi:hypothetical protein